MNDFASHVIANKLKYIKVKLKIWNGEVFGDIRTKKCVYLSIINSLDAKEESNGLTSNELLQRKVAKDDWAKFTLMEERYKIQVQYEVLKDMKLAILDFHKSIFTELESWRPKALRDVDKENIERDFTKEEVVKALFDWCRDKALGPDGMFMAFSSIKLEYGKNKCDEDVF